ncbi:hypothetical protein [Chryseobacterium sp. Leaf201]|uniref:hypothetical protein n=1 Tax=Chryseobacterium sp. Leaf201 TaxID=1735672 RepID=UPI0006FD6539|nr:hypothetical protein [Chryseobacterium sp. Leaf201]KQM54301.1 hypothetical protein ASE55_19560 [Chryseobacterium sp. Leaf201]
MIMVPDIQLVTANPNNNPSRIWMISTTYSFSAMIRFYAASSGISTQGKPTSAKNILPAICIN